MANILEYVSEAYAVKTIDINGNSVGCKVHSVWTTKEEAQEQCDKIKKRYPYAGVQRIDPMAPYRD